MIRIVQCLCPARHCILACAYDEAQPAPISAVEELRLILTAQIEKGRLNPWCGICKSRDWKYEDSPTKFTTMAEAAIELTRIEEENDVARALAVLGNLFN